MKEDLESFKELGILLECILVLSISMLIESKSTNSLFQS